MSSRLYRRHGFRKFRHWNWAAVIQHITDPADIVLVRTPDGGVDHVEITVDPQDGGGRRTLSMERGEHRAFEAEIRARLDALRAPPHQNAPEDGAVSPGFFAARRSRRRPAWRRAAPSQGPPG